MSICPFCLSTTTLTKNRINNNLDLFQIPSLLHQSIDNPKSSQPTVSDIIKSPSINRVRLAIEAIERNTKHFPRGRKS
jgi:hypothetical protein